MARRRSRGEGSIYFDDKRNRWIVQMWTLEGKRISRSTLTERDARELKRQLEDEQRKGKDLTARMPTLAALTVLWLRDVIQPNQKPNTHYQYGSVMDLYVLPDLGHYKLDEINTPMIQRWVNSFKERKLSASTVRNAYARLKFVLDTAVSWHYITSNPAIGVKLPKLKPSVDHSYTIEEAQQLLAACEDWRLKALIWTMILLGMRRGEALGLVWRDYDRKAGTIKVSQQIQEIDGKVVISPTPKNDQTRTLPLTPGLEQLYQALWTERQDERRLIEDWKEHGLIFPSNVGTPLAPSNFNRAFTALCKRAGVRKIRIHDMRHTTATLLGEQGEQEAVIAALLGHTPATITRRYAHVKIETLRAAVERLERTLTGDMGIGAREGQR